VTGIAWENPPPSRWRGMDAPGWVEELVAHPGRWARVHECPSVSAASNYAKRTREGLVAWARPAGSWEAVARVVDGRAWVYARYLGEAGGAS
jgi:hypothetical protein